MICGSPMTTSVLVTTSPTPKFLADRSSECSSLQGGMVAHVVGCVAVRRLPEQLTAIQIDSGEQPITAASKSATRPVQPRNGAAAADSRCRRVPCGRFSRLTMPASAAQQSPGPQTSANGRPAMPET